MFQKYNRKPLQVEAVQYDITKPDKSRKDMSRMLKKEALFVGAKRIWVQLPNGQMYMVEAGDYLVRQGKNNIYVMNKALFENHFAKS